MEIRRLLRFGNTVGLTIPKRYSTELDLHWKGYIEISLEDEHLIIRKHATTTTKKEA